MCIDKVVIKYVWPTESPIKAYKGIWYLTKIQDKVFARLFWQDEIFIQINKWVLAPIGVGYTAYERDVNGKLIGDPINVSGFHTYEKAPYIYDDIDMKILACEVKRITVEGTQENKKVFVSNFIKLIVPEEDLKDVKDVKLERGHCTFLMEE